MKELIVGPWVGEFGYELIWWNPHIRWIVNNNQYDHITTIGPKNSQYLYEFANKYIDVRTKPISFWDGELLDTIDFKKYQHCDIITPKDVFRHKFINDFKRSGREKEISQQRKWKNFVDVWYPSDDLVFSVYYDVLYSFRPPKSYKGKPIPGKEYPIKLCKQLIDLMLSAGLKIAAYGGMENYYFDGTDDYRGESLFTQCGLLERAGCAIGPSNGAIHLASLCSCPHITWCSHPLLNLRKRYEKEWNPFNTKVTYLNGKPPKPEHIFKEMLSILNDK